MTGNTLTPLEHSKEHWAACHDCDLLLPIHDITIDYVARCPRCRALLYRHKNNSMNRTLALSLSGLLFYLPANLLPLLSLDVLGNVGHSTMLNGLFQLWQQGFWWMAFLVATCSVIMPLLQLCLLLYIAGSLRLKRYTLLLPKAIKLQRLSSTWAMLEVYLLGIIVAIVKMRDSGDLLIGQALFCFVALLLFTLLAQQSYDRHEAWQSTSRLRKQLQERQHVK